MVKELHYFALYKPYNVICQFTQENNQDTTLKDIIDVPTDVYPVGRLDKDSEGLLLLTNDSTLNAQLLQPTNKIPKTYLVQIEGIPGEESLLTLRNGMYIQIQKKRHLTQPALVHLTDEPKNIPERKPPIRFRINKPTSWLRITVREGKNRQIRKMCAAVGLPVLRLIRISIGKYTLPTLENGFFQSICKSEIL